MEFTLQSPGHYMYHPHLDEMTKTGLACMGMFYRHPNDPRNSKRHPRRSRFQPDALGVARSIRAPPAPNPIEMVELIIFTINSKAYPATRHWSSKGRTGSHPLWKPLSDGSHPSILHGYQFRITRDNDAGRIPDAASFSQPTRCWFPSAQTRAEEFVADAEGDWALHCLCPIHTMTRWATVPPTWSAVNTKGLDSQIIPSCPAT